MNKEEKFRKERNLKIQKALKESLKYLDLEVDVQDAIREKIIKAYIPKEEDLKYFIRQEVITAARSIETLSAAIEQTIEKIVTERIKSLSADFINEIKEEIIGRISSINDY